MARVRPSAAALKNRLARLRALQDDGATTETVTEIRVALADPSEHVVAKAAELTGELEVTDLEPELVAAFQRLMTGPIENDHGCVAKSACVEALVRLGADQPEVYLAAARHVQLEPVWGGRTDTAAGLRGAGAMGLVRGAHSEAYEIVAALLADKEEQARVGAADAAGHGAPHVVVPLLRLKVLAGDVEPRVLGACFGALLAVAPRESLAFVVRFLDEATPEVQEAAALVLGESQLPEAFELLRAWGERATFRDAGRVALLAISLMRLPAALDHLIALVGTAPVAVARQALEAVSVHCEREGVRDRVASAARGRKGRELDAMLEEVLCLR
jgi:hypothetical protein